MKLHKTLKARREKASITQKNIADMCGAKPQYVCNYERGACSGSTELMKAYKTLLPIKKSELIELILKDHRIRLNKSL